MNHQLDKSGHSMPFRPTNLQSDPTQTVDLRLDWHMPPDIPVLDRAIAGLLGTADIMSQLSDRAYLEECRDILFAEFCAFGLAGAAELLCPDPETLSNPSPGLLYRPAVRSHAVRI